MRALNEAFNDFVLVEMICFSNLRYNLHNSFPCRHALYLQCACICFAMKIPKMPRVHFYFVHKENNKIEMFMSRHLVRGKLIRWRIANKDAV